MGGVIQKQIDEVCVKMGKIWWSKTRAHEKITSQGFTSCSQFLRWVVTEWADVKDRGEVVNQTETTSVFFLSIEQMAIQNMLRVNIFEKACQFIGIFLVCYFLKLWPIYAATS